MNNITYILRYECLYCEKEANLNCDISKCCKMPIIEYFVCNICNGQLEGKGINTEWHNHYEDKASDKSK